VTRIGRDTKLNDVVIPHDTVSSQHADIEYRDGVFHLRDLLSTNGTFVNGKKFSDTEQICEVALKNRDRLRFDAYEFEFVVDALENAEQTKLPGPEPVRRTRLRPEPHDGQNGAQEVVSPQPVEGVANAPANGEERPTKLKGDMCQQHPSIKVTERCEGCGRECCKLCVIEQDGRILCRAICAAQLT
jgi:pSer/pThr/pTyr-binding forkhead associated (FHA) protein